MHLEALNHINNIQSYPYILSDVHPGYHFLRHLSSILKARNIFRVWQVSGSIKDKCSQHIFLNWICPSCFSSIFSPSLFLWACPTSNLCDWPEKCRYASRLGVAGSWAQGLKVVNIRLEFMVHQWLKCLLKSEKYVSNMVSISHLCLLSSWHSKLERKMFLGMESCNHRCQGVWWSTTVLQNTQLS